MSKTIEEILTPKPEARPRIYAYAIADQAHAGLLKVGQTTRDVKQRVGEQLKTAAIKAPPASTSGQRSRRITPERLSRFQISIGPKLTIARTPITISKERSRKTATRTSAPTPLPRRWRARRSTTAPAYGRPSVATQVIITSDTYPKEISGIDDRLISRFDSGLTVAIEPPELEMRVAILMRKAQSEGVNLSEDVAFFVAKHLRWASTASSGGSGRGSTRN